MALSKKTRIAIAISISVVFFFVEIIVGYTAHSLALVADAFHMLNDIISLSVGYWAADVAENKSSSDGYTYGWARAEILGGLINGIFLIALCTTIILDAIQRFFEIEEVKNPQLVLIVGGVGLLFNIVGLFLFHQHDHGDGHSHGAGEEEGHGHSHSHDEHAHAEHGHGDDLHSAEEEAISHGNGKADHSDHAKKQGSKDSSSGHKRTHSRSYSTIQSLPIHPAALRHDMRVKARFGDADSAEYDTEDDNALADDGQQVSETSPLLQKAKETATARRSKSISHHDHNHATKPKVASSGHGHDHDDNLRGMFLHVLGDALGNVGVMASAIIIWKWDNPYRFYFDPAISLFITLIILKSAIPLVRDTAKPLLQATPEHVNVQDIREDIMSLPGIVSCHHIHVWALTRSKLVATMDVQLDFEAGEKGQLRWMELARAIKACLRGWDIYSSTVQPEWCINEQHGHGSDGEGDNGEGSSTGSATSPKVTVVPSDGGKVTHAPCEHGECLLADDGGAGMQCCQPTAGSSGATTPNKKGKGAGGGGHDHGHDDEHGHGHGHGHDHAH